MGVLTLGTRLDQAFADRIARETGARVSFANLHGVLASSSPSVGNDRGDLAMIRRSLLERMAIFHADFAQYRSVQYQPLKVVDETFCLVLENDLGVLRAMLHRNKVLLAKAGAVLML